MMEMIELLMDVRKELHCAEKYANEANKHMHEYPELSQVYRRIATEKVNHAEMLSSQAEKMADKAGMKAVWDVEEMMIDADMERVKKCLDQRHK